MQHNQPTTLADLVAQSIPDIPTPTATKPAREVLPQSPIPTLADLVAQSVPDSPRVIVRCKPSSDLVLRDYAVETAKAAEIGFTERRLREGRAIMGWRIGGVLVKRS